METHAEVMGGVVLCPECHLDFSFPVLQSVLKLWVRSGAPITLASDRADSFALYFFFHFPFFLSLEASHAGAVSL